MTRWFSSGQFATSIAVPIAMIGNSPVVVDFARRRRSRLINNIVIRGSVLFLSLRILSTMIDFANCGDVEPIFGRSALLDTKFDWTQEN